MKYLLLCLVLAACGDDGSVKTVEELQNPETCKECHPQHYQEWSGSMHAYASDDPVFVAMNNRGQRETQGKLKDFCISCHAPMAVALGLSDGTNFDPAALPPAAKGVTCFFCHNVNKVTDVHNNPLQLAMDQTMRGGAEDPKGNPAHHSKYDTLMDSDRNESEMCGACHDINVPEAINGVPGGVDVERTFQEWQTTFFHTDKRPGIHLTCGACHMFSKDAPIADFEGVGSRTNGYHEHAFPAVDQALTPFPEMPAQTDLIARDLKSSVAIIGTNMSGLGGICVNSGEGGQITVRVDTINLGHSFPSGASQDRRMWVETVAYDVNNNVIFSSGVVPPGMDPEQINDPQLFGLWDRIFKQDNSIAHFFWEIARIDSQLLKPPVTNDITDPRVDHSTTKSYKITGMQNIVERVTTRIYLRALPYEVVDDLIGSGDLAAGIRDQIQTLEIPGGRREWRKADRDPGSGCCKPSDKCRPPS
jgi:nitrate/TMAO reductase-like tetraheme cytochrome c subunit